MKSINFEYNCTECKEKLLPVENKLHCNNCLCDYECENNCGYSGNYNEVNIHEENCNNFHFKI